MQLDRLIKLGCLVEDAEAPDPEVAFGGEVPAPVVEQPQEPVKEVTEKTDPKGKKSAMPYLTDTELRTSLAAHMGTTLAELDDKGPQWSVIASEANESSFHHLRAILINRGYSGSVIDGWDARVIWSKRLGICHCLRSGVIHKEIDRTILEAACKVEEQLEKVPITVSGELVNPDSFGVSVGSMTVSDDDDTITGIVRDNRYFP
jgi:hypothetical protein